MLARLHHGQSWGATCYETTGHWPLSFLRKSPRSRFLAENQLNQGSVTQRNPEPVTSQHKNPSKSMHAFLSLISNNMKACYLPTVPDVFHVQHALLHFVPAELAALILEMAEYWPAVTSTREALTGPMTALSYEAEWCYLLTPPIPSSKVRQITFNIESMSGCMFNSICSEYTNFAAAIIKPYDVSQNIMLDNLEDCPERQIHEWNISQPQRWLVQDIQRSWPQGHRKELVWDRDHAHEEAKTGRSPLLHRLTKGDRVAVMVRGLIPGWMNCIYNITTSVQYSI